MKIGIKEFFQRLIYINPALPPRQIPFYKKAVRFLYTVGKVFIDTSGLQRAAALAFATLFGIFPLVGVLLFLIPVFFGSGGMDQEVGRVILTYLLPATGDKLENTMKGYFEVYQRSATQIGVLGLIGLLASGIALFIIVEQTFNDIWRVERRRSFLKASTVFAGVIVWMPLFIGLSIYITREFAHRAQGISTNFMNFLPFILFFLGLSLAYILIPNTRVNIPSALAGALFGAFFWELARTLFDRSIKIFPTYNMVQSVGAIPYFLIWLYINWVIILIGIIIAYCAQNYQLLLREDISARARVLDPVVLLMMLFFIGKKFLSGEGSVNLSELRNLCPIPPKDFNQHVEYLERNKMILRTSDNECVALARPPEKIQLQDFLQFFNKAKTMFHFSAIDESGEQFLQRLKQMDNNMAELLSGKTLASFLS